MNEDEIERLLNLLDGKGSNQEYDAIEEIRKISGDRFPYYLHMKYRKSKRMAQRASCVFFASGYARSSEDAFQLGLEALHDKSQVVRYRACGLLAFAQNLRAMPFLRLALEKFESHQVTRADVSAAIDAIENKNHHYFHDRKHSGMVTWNVTEM
jgi:hypothetical protein